ncbi:hypothetical protein OUZ56_033414 [Daphnia magna]|uniref:Uncharacterized protein n=1 Tax=Daphnia magna TaxID=35525 RepID=A0ABQ9ZY16_9CRUS|nr:hypothetical protein OUZ56_026331 [Daphnia magna]KAK4017708.1 hypothetical protein OUZ56_033414 [Daphnia magna]
MNEYVITCGPKIARTPLLPIVPEISVPLSNEESVAISLNFDKSPTVSQLAPHTSSEGMTPEILTELTSKCISPVVIPQVGKDNSQSSSPIQQNQERPQKYLSAQDEPASVPSPCDQEPEGERSGLPVDRSEDLGTADLVDPGHPAFKPLPSQPEPSDGVDGTNNPADTSDVDPSSATPSTGEEDSDIGATGIQPDSDLHIVREIVPDILAESCRTSRQNDETILDSIPDSGPFIRHREERYLHLSSEVKELSIPLETLLLAYQETFLVYIHNLILYLRELRLLTPLEPLVPEINSLLRKLDNFPGANNPNNLQLAEIQPGDPTNVLPNQDTTETIPTV